MGVDKKWYLKGNVAEKKAIKNLKGLSDRV